MTDRFMKRLKPTHSQNIFRDLSQQTAPKKRKEKIKNMEDWQSFKEEEKILLNLLSKKCGKR